MKKAKLLFLTLAVAFSFSGLTLSVFAPAASALTAVEKQVVVVAASGCGVKTSVISCDRISDNPIINMLYTIINFLAVGVGIAVVGGILWGSITYIRSNGNASVAQQGITIIVNAVVGLLLFIFMYAIINFLVPGGLFT